MATAREAALRALEKCRRAGAWSDAVLGSVMDAAGLQGPERGLCAALCYGVLQNRTLLDYALQSRSAMPLNRVEPKVLDILRLSACQILLMEKIPAPAAVNEGVRLCRSLGFARAAGYVNAVLRALAADPRLPKPQGDSAQRLSILYSHPRWLVDLLLARLGEVETEELLRGNNRPAPLHLQVNTLNTTTQALERQLQAEGVKTERHPELPDCLIAEPTGALARLDSFRAGYFYVQDPAARLSVLAAAPRPGERVLDLCASPGGKSFAAAIASGGGAQITACDIHENKLHRLRTGAERLGISVETLAADARENRADWNGQFDLVIADVPCSGLGVIRKKPDIRWKDPAPFGKLPALQRTILSNAARYVRPGGRLLYATCTLRPEENEEVAAAFAGREDFEALDFDGLRGARSSEGMLQLWPQRHGTDGFFIALMRKRT